MTSKNPRHYEWDDYFIPDARTLRNKLGNDRFPYGTENPIHLEQAEVSHSIQRMSELEDHPIEGNFDFDHMRAIHNHLFQDVYEWAGDPRTVDLSKFGHGYAHPDRITDLWEAQHRALKKNNYLRGITDQDKFADRLAFYWGMTNYTHSFREGNTRSQTMFFKQIADQAGWELDISKFAPNHSESIRDRFVDARFHFIRNDFDPSRLANVLNEALSPKEPQHEAITGFVIPSISDDSTLPSFSNQSRHPELPSQQSTTSYLPTIPDDREPEL